MSPNRERRWFTVCSVLEYHRREAWSEGAWELLSCIPQRVYRCLDGSGPGDLPSVQIKANACRWWWTWKEWADQEWRRSMEEGEDDLLIWWRLCDGVMAWAPFGCCLRPSLLPLMLYLVFHTGERKSSFQYHVSLLPPIIVLVFYLFF